MAEDEKKEPTPDAKDAAAIDRACDILRVHFTDFLVLARPIRKESTRLSLRLSNAEWAQGALESADEMVRGIRQDG